MQYWLEYRAQRIELHRGLTLIGRSSACHVVLDDALVSRRHASITVTPESAHVDDLGSVNGVFVNEARIFGRRLLKSGDRLVVGAQAMTLRASGQPSERGKEATLFVKTLDGSSVAIPLRPPSEPPEDSQTSTTDLSEVLGAVAEKNLALGRGQEAERILQGYLNLTLEQAQATELKPFALERATDFALKLAAATSKGSWVDYALRLHTLHRQPMARELVESIYALIPKVSAVSLVVLREYLAVLREVQVELGPAERFVVQRLEGLERLVLAK